MQHAENESDDDDAEWESFNEPEVAPTVDLFSDRVFESAAAALAHAKAAHGLDLASIAFGLKLDIYGRVRLVNYVRSRAAAADESAAIVKSVKEGASSSNGATWPWADDKFLVPVLPEDPLLYSLGAPTSGGDQQHGDDEELMDTEDAPPAQIVAEGIMGGAASGGAAVGPNGETEALLETINAMRSEMVSMLGLGEDGGGDGGGGGGGGSGAPSIDVTEPTDGGGAGGSTAAASSKAGAAGSSAAAAADGKASGAREGQYGSAESAESSYFESYAKLAIHEDMLSDHTRTQGYKDAIMRNASLIRGKVVLDVGCGTGILSMFCAQAGAAHVVAVDASDIVSMAKRIVSANKLADRITVLRGTMETVDVLGALPAGVSKVDVIISEWMGYALLYESMLPSVLWARDKYLAPTGVVLPTACDMLLSLSAHHRLGFWDDVYGFDMTAMRERALGEASVEVVPSESLLSAPGSFRLVDCERCSDADLDFTAPFSLTAGSVASGAVVKGEYTVRSFVLHFDALFDCSGREGGERTAFTTGPQGVPTHWKQTALYLKEPLSVRPGDVVSGTVACSRGFQYKRAYDIFVTYQVTSEHDQSQTAAVTQFWQME
jgi:SAM-dependent methyltransferase